MAALFDALLANPAVILTVGAFALLALPRHLAQVWMLLVAGFSAIKLSMLGLGEYGALSLFGEQLVTVRVDPLAELFTFVLMFSNSTKKQHIVVCT